MIYRLAKAEDAKALFHLEQELFEAHNYPISLRMFRYHLQNNILLVAVDKDLIIGYILLLRRKGWLKIYSLGVAKSHRGKKIAATLLEELDKEAKKRDSKKIVLEVREDNSAALSLYEKNGYKKIKQIAKFYKDGCSAWVMEKHKV